MAMSYKYISKSKANMIDVDKLICLLISNDFDPFANISKRKYRSDLISYLI